MPKLSVLLPVYNTRESHLRVCIESVLSQTFSDFEFIILNDASTDENIEKIINSYRDSRIIYIENEKNFGISESRNRLINLSRGEYLAVVDHDDISLPCRFAEEVEWLDLHPETGIVSGIIESWLDDEKKIIMEVPEADIDIQRKMLMECCCWHPACMIRKSVLQEHNVRYEKFFFPSEDYALFCRLIGKTEFRNIQKTLLYYRNHSKNTSHIKAKEMRDITNVIQDFARRENPELWRLVSLDLFRKHRIRVFGFLPIIKIEESFDRIDVYLFSKIRLLTIEKGNWREK